MRTMCSKCYYNYSDYTRGMDCSSYYCHHKNICENCSVTLNIKPNNTVCNDCMEYGPPTFMQSIYRYLAMIF